MPLSKNIFAHPESSALVIKWSNLKILALTFNLVHFRFQIPSRSTIATPPIRRRPKWASSSRPTSSAPSPACASTRRRRTPAPTSARCGRSPASRWRRRQFTSESASGWQTVSFSSPVAVQPNTTYVASYYAPNGHFSASAAYFYNSPAPGPIGGAVVDSPPLHAVRNTGTTANGVYRYGASGVPQQQLRRLQLLGRRDLHADGRARHRDGRQRHLGRPHLGQRQLVGARERRRGHLLPDHALRRLDRAARDDDHRLAAGDDHDDHRADHTARPTRSGSRRSTPTAQARPRQRRTP